MAEKPIYFLRRSFAIQRIKRMERCYDSLRASPSPRLRGILTRYYASGRWLRDYELDEQGLLPQGLKRGVLSQDGLWDLLQDQENG